MSQKEIDKMLFLNFSDELEDEDYLANKIFNL